MLVLCVDRDDDIGRKTGIRTPIIGREENLKAAVALGTADPEEADTNAIFGAINTYDELIKEGYEVEIAAICGSKFVGIESDRILARELEEVLRKTGADEIFLVSDGAEDEYILPVVTSRAKVSSVRRVVVKQSKSIEDTYYFIKKFFEDEKTQLRLVVPLAILLIATSIFQIMVSGFEIQLSSLIVLIMGVYLISNPTFKLMRYFWHSITTGKLSFFMYAVSSMVILGSFIYVYNNIVTTSGMDTYERILTFIELEAIWVLIAMALSGAGRLVETYVSENKIIASYWVFFFSLVAIWFIVMGSTGIIRYSITGVPFGSPLLIPVIIDIALGLGIVTAGVISYGYIRSRVEK